MSEQRTIRSFATGKTFLIAHTDHAGHGVAQIRVNATRDIRTTTDARAAFEATHPDRSVLAIGVKGES